MIQKQTVYLTVNIEGASGNHIPDKSVLIVKEQGEMDKYWDAIVKPQEGYFFTPEQLNEYTANVIKQTLETAAEKVTVKESYETDDYGDVHLNAKIQKESITNTFEETFKNFEV